VLRAAATKLPSGFTVTLPKVETVMAVQELIAQLGGTDIGIELMIETPRAIVDASGKVAIPALIEAAGDRLVALHLGAYDLTASLGVTAVDQRLDHPFCDFARSAMAFATNGQTTIVDGATTMMPIGDRAAVHRAWQLHAKNVRRAIDFGMWQGWDLHPAQVPARYGALFGYFLDHREAMTARLRSFLDNRARATRVGQDFDDAATGRGLFDFFERGVRCGALDEADVLR